MPICTKVVELDQVLKSQLRIEIMLKHKEDIDFQSKTKKKKENLFQIFLNSWGLQLFSKRILCSYII